MNLNIIRSKNETEGLILSNTKNCETFIEQIQRKAGETLLFKLTKQRETFHFKPLVQVEGSRTIGTTILDFYNFIFNITKENHDFEIYTPPLNDEFS